MASSSFVGRLFTPAVRSGARRKPGIGRPGAVSGRLAHLLGMRDDTAIDGLERMLSTSQFAEYLCVAPQAMYDLRITGRGPRAVHVGRELRYRVSEIRAWLDRMSEPAGAADGVDHAR